MPTEYLTSHEPAARIKYDPRTIRERLKDSVLIEGVHSQESDLSSQSKHVSDGPQPLQNGRLVASLMCCAGSTQ